MASKEHTTIVIAHRLSTIQGVDRIAFIAGGKVLEYGSHSELLKLGGRYRRLVDSQNRSANVNAAMLRKAATKTGEDEEEDDKPDFEAQIEEAEKNSFSIKRARDMASPDSMYMLLGSIGAVFAGGVFPSWGILFAET
jgi:ATP-binding cassette subfamily B (MDR/TAP) protein 1